MAQVRSVSVEQVMAMIREQDQAIRSGGGEKARLVSHADDFVGTPDLAYWTFLKSLAFGAGRPDSTP